MLKPPAFGPLVGSTDLDHGWRLALVQHPGAPWMWLLSPTDGEVGCACRECAPHEQLGPLPAKYAEQVGAAPRCGRATRSGSPCRRTVRKYGAACAQHRE